MIWWCMYAYCRFREQNRDSIRKKDVSCGEKWNRDFHIFSLGCSCPIITILTTYSASATNQLRTRQKDFCSVFIHSFSSTFLTRVKWRGGLAWREEWRGWRKPFPSPFFYTKFIHTLTNQPEKISIFVKSKDKRRTKKIIFIFFAKRDLLHVLFM